MNKYLLASLLSCSFSILSQTTVFAAPSKSDISTLPAKVKTYLPQGATSFYSQRLPIGPNATKMLVHIWAATRPNTADSMNSYNRFTNSPFCVDVFAPVLNEEKRWGWQLVSSAAYMDTDVPLAVKPHWLEPAKKQGPLLQIISSNGAPGVSTIHTVLVWDRGFQIGLNSPTPQLFSSGGQGGGMITTSFDKVDERGKMKIIVENSFADKVQSTESYQWNGRHFELTGTTKR